MTSCMMGGKPSGRNGAGHIQFASKVSVSPGRREKAQKLNKNRHKLPAKPQLVIFWR